MGEAFKKVRMINIILLAKKSREIRRRDNSVCKYTFRGYVTTKKQ